MNEIDIKKLLKVHFKISTDKRRVKEIDITNLIYDGIAFIEEPRNLRFKNTNNYIEFLKNSCPDIYEQLSKQFCEENQVKSGQLSPASIQEYLRGELSRSYIIKEVDLNTNTLAICKGSLTITNVPFRGLNILKTTTGKDFYSSHFLEYIQSKFDEDSLYFIDLKKGKKCYLNEYYYDSTSINIYPKSDFIKINGRTPNPEFLLKSDPKVAQDYITGEYNLKDFMFRIYDKDWNIRYFKSQIPFIYYLENRDFVPVFDNYSQYTSFYQYVRDYGKLELSYLHFGLIESKEIADKHPDKVKEIEYLGLYIRSTDVSSKNVKEYNLHLPYFNHIQKAENLSFTDKVRYGMESPTYIFTSGKQYTYGVELETASGNLPYYVMKEFNVKTMRDGSIVGNEFVTGILKGDAGLFHLNKLITEVNKRCTIDNRCSIHVHLGGAIFNRELLVTLYHLGLRIQDELFTMLPESRRRSKYCLPLNEIMSSTTIKKGEKNYDDFLEKYYGAIYNSVMLGMNKNTFVGINKETKEVSPGLGPKNNKTRVHREGRWNSYRYYWLNLQPAMFATRENDAIDMSRMFNIEFRNHSPSLNYTKIKNWILILMSVLSFAENNKKRIFFNSSPITLREILFSELFEKPIEIKGKIISLPNYLNNYIEERKQLFSQSNSKLEDVYSEGTTNVNKISDLICA